MKAIENYSITQTGSYRHAFWQEARLHHDTNNVIDSGKVPGNSSYFMPERENDMIRAKILENSSIRSLATAMNHYSGNLDIISASSEDAV